jgi:uncharacterized OsmC-like protein
LIADVPHRTQKHSITKETDMTTTSSTRNGINVDQLLDTIEATKADEAVGTFTFRAASTWQDGTHSIGAIQGFTHAGAEDDTRSQTFTLHGDEPPVLLGSNAGPNAVELVLQALAYCYAVGYVANAAAQGIEVESMEYAIEGDLDLHAFLGLEGGRPGFTKIRATGVVSSPNATKEQLTELCRYVQDTSPVRDTLANAVPIHTELEVLG